MNVAGTQPHCGVRDAQQRGPQQMAGRRVQTRGKGEMVGDPDEVRVEHGDHQVPWPEECSSRGSTLGFSA